MAWHISISLLIVSWTAVLPTMAEVVTSTPPGGPVTIHNGAYTIDIDADGKLDFTISNAPSSGTGSAITGSWSRVLQETGTGVYRGSDGLENAAALNLGQEVGPALAAGFLYADNGLHPSPTLHGYNVASSTSVGDPAWLDGQHHFVGTDLLVGADHHYGWIELSLQDSGVPTTAQPWYDVTVYHWAYDTQANQTITIPEPSPLGALLIIVVAATAIRRRRQTFPLMKLAWRTR